MSAMVWSLNVAEQAAVRDMFSSLDVSNTGTIKLRELRDVFMSIRGANRDQVVSLLSAFEITSRDEITYSEFLAAMCGSRIRVNDGHVRDVFRRFDVDGCGLITSKDMTQVLGEYSDELLAEADKSGDGAVSFVELNAYLRPGRWHACFSRRAVAKVQRAVCCLPLARAQDGVA